MSKLEQQIEAILFFKNEPVTLGELSAWLKVSKSDVQTAIIDLQKQFDDRGIVVITNGDEVALGTHPELSDLIEDLQKEDLSREIGRAGIETLAIVAYKGPISRRELDYIRGVNSSFILRNLMIRGLIERTELPGERSYAYKPTLELFKYLGITKREELPEFSEAFTRLEEFKQTETDAPEA